MAALVSRGIGRTNGAIAMSFGAHVNLCTHNILRNGTEAQKQAYLSKLVSTEMIGGLALSEPNAGSDAMGIQITAKPTDGGYLLNGMKMFITNGPIADLLVVYAKTKPEAGSRGITAFIAETKTPGFSVSRKLQKLGMHGSPTGELVFEEVFIMKRCKFTVAGATLPISRSNACGAMRSWARSELARTRFASY
jgi:isovaleryl-CoA dehydrogenase